MHYKLIDPIVEAVQFLGYDDGMRLKFSDSPKWLDTIRKSGKMYRNKVLRLYAYDGLCTVNKGDWIVSNKGMIFHFTAVDFEQTFKELD